MISEKNFTRPIFLDSRPVLRVPHRILLLAQHRPTIKKKERKKENNSLRRLSTKVENQCLQAVPFLLKTEQSSLTLWTLRSASIFSILLSIHFLWNWQGESIQQSMFLRLVIIHFILMISMNDSAVKLWNEKLNNGHF